MTTPYINAAWFIIELGSYTWLSFRKTLLYLNCKVALVIM
jgi:hypothetical protein